MATVFVIDIIKNETSAASKMRIGGAEFGTEAGL